MQILIISFIQIGVFIALASSSVWILSEQFRRRDLAQSGWQLEYQSHRCGSVEAAKNNLNAAIALINFNQNDPKKTYPIENELMRLGSTPCPKGGKFSIKTYHQINPNLLENYPNWHYQINTLELGVL